MAPCAPDCPPTRRCAAGSASGSNSVRRSFRCSIDRVGGPCVPPCWRVRPMADVELHGVTKRFGDLTAVSDLSLFIRDGECVVLLGPTGAGKTTTLRLVAGLEKPDVGRIAIAGHDVTKIPPAGRDVTFVFQQYSLYPHLTVYDNLAFPLRSPLRRVPEAEIKRKVGEAPELRRITAKLDNRATKLSGADVHPLSMGRGRRRQPAVYLIECPGH